MFNLAGKTRDVFAQLYWVCFGAELIEHSRKEMIFKESQWPHQTEFVSVFSGGYKELKNYFGPDLPVDFGMIFTAPSTIGDSVIHTWIEDGHQRSQECRCNYYINESRLRKEFGMIYRPRNRLFKDACIDFEAEVIALIAHEIRHELQYRGIIPRAFQHRSLPSLRPLTINTRVFRTITGLTLQYRDVLAKYGKRLEAHRPLLEFELDAISTQLRAYMAWADSWTFPRTERLLRVRDAIFSVSHDTRLS